LPFCLLQRSLLIAAIVLASTVLITFPDTSAPDQWAHFFSDHLNDLFQVLAHLLIFVIAWRWRSWRPLRLDLAIAVVVTGIVQLSKRFLIAPIAIRPSGGYEGFPSGHASATFSLAFLLSLYYPKWWPLWYGFAALITWSRVQTNAHSELQIAAGMIFGTLVAYGFARTIWREKKM
jgi:membrane-associated phospholipid phosphatase